MMLDLIAQPVLRSLHRIAIALSVLVMATVGFAQNTNNPSTSDKPSESPASKPQPVPAIGPPARGLKAGMDDVFELMDKDGQIRFLPHWRTLEKFEQWLKSQEANNNPLAPAVSVSSVSFEGAAETNDDSITLDATLTISINRDDEDVLVPLGLNEATLLKKVEHVGPGELEFHKFDPEIGYRCWLRGKGPHELKMTLAVPLRRQGVARRLMLRLPETPGSSIKLIVPLPKVSAKGLERGFVKTKSLENGRTEIQAFGPPGSLLDLSWQPVSDVSEVKSELQAITFIAADLRAESFVLEATQQVRSIQGTFDKIVVRLPPEFELLDVSGREVKESAAIPGSPARVLVTLTGPTSGPVVLKWVMSSKVAADAARLPALEGFEVADARQQKGHIAVIAWEGVNLRKRDGEDRFVDRDTLAALRDVPDFHPPTSGNGNTTIYRFLKQPFRLMLDVQKIEPYFSAEQSHLVRLATNRADLETTLLVRVFRGSLLDLVLPWPGFKAEGWEAISNDTPDIVEQVAVEETPSGSQLRVRLVDRKTRGNGEFEIRLTTRRAIPTNDAAFNLTLPFVAASGQKASQVIVAPSSNLEVEWTPQNETLARPTTPDEEVLDVLESTRNVTAWRWETGTPAFSAKAKVQQQAIRIESVSDLAVATRSVTVKQRIGYEVAFEPLTQVRLMVPRAIAERVRFQLRDSSGQSKPLPPPRFTGLEIDQARQCRLPLDQPQVGKFEVLAEFEVERTSDMSDEPVLVSVPVLQSSDAELSATRVQWKTGEKWTATLDDSAWTSELGPDKTSIWKANGARNTIAIKIASTSDSALQDFTVHRALIRTVLGEGRSHSQALLELDRDVREITLTLPPEIAAQKFQAWWNGVAVIVEPLARGGTTGGESEVRLRRPLLSKTALRDTADEGKTRASLWFDYVSQQPTHFGWSNRHELVAPQFASTVWIAQTIWQVVLPSDQHLLTAPRDYALQYHWQRSLIMWSRQPNFGYERIDRVLQEAAMNRSDGASMTAFAAGDSGSLYPLSCFGSPQPLVFWTMSRAAVVGCGAGLALLLGFVLIRLPATRHVLTFLVVGFLMALAALWFSEPVKVLLQPAILGAVMAVVAAIIDRVGRRDPQTPLVTLSSPSDFYASSGSGVRGVGGGGTFDASTSPPQGAVPNEPISAGGAGGRT
ncbi:MAG: hypothetical protein ACKV2Q_18320 [Planctomycetaceae bacterium]